MTPKRIILVRYGRPKANDDPTMYSRLPDYKIELVEQGREEALQAGDHIRELIGGESYGIYVSPYRRTVQTKDCIVERIGHAPAFDYQEPYLREQEMGNMPAIIDNELNWAAALALSECGDNAVSLNGAGGRLFMGSCEISNIKDAGIYLTANTSARFSGVSIVSCAKEAIYTRGECIHRQLKVENCKQPIKVGGCGRNVCSEEDFVVPDFYFGRFTKRNITGNAD